MKHRRFCCFPALSLWICFFNPSYGQNNERSLYRFFDETIESKNSGLNNGTVHSNPYYRSSDNSSRYYAGKDYTVASIIYDGQPYSEILLKYDLLEDRVITKLAGENNIGINLINEKVTAFYIGGIKFSRLDFKALNQEHESGFYEETAIDPDLTLFTRHKKTRIEMLREKVLFHNFEENDKFLVRLNGSWHKIASKSSVIDLAPAYESGINGFYRSNESLQKSDKKMFFIKLLQFLSTFLNQKNTP